MADDTVLSKKRQALLRIGVDETEDADIPSTEKLRELMERAAPMIDQLNSLYNQYMSGAADRTPDERRNQLDNIMHTVTLMAKPTKALRFKYNTLHGKYTTYRDRWDKLLRDLEKGRISRGRKRFTTRS